MGCTLTCSFCHTGTQKLVRNLTAAEIIGQVMVVRDDLGEWPEIGAKNVEGRLLSNIVLMGMGEPLYNFEDVRDAMKIAMDPEGISLSRRRITLSTSGVVPEFARTAEEIGCQLAVTFHATTDEVRDRLVPINKTWNIETLLDALRVYPKVSEPLKRITFEYVMLRGMNDSDEDARRLVQLIKGIPAKTPQPDPLQRMARRALREVVQQPHPCALLRSSIRPAMPAPSGHRVARISWPCLRTAEIGDRTRAQVPQGYRGGSEIQLSQSSRYGPARNRRR